MTSHRFSDHELALWRIAHGENIPVPPKPRKRDNEESRIQCEFIHWWAVRAGELGIPEVLLFSIPNGGWRSKVGGAIMKREGARPGIPDLMLAIKRGKYAGAFLEMKKPDGKPSEIQKKVMWLLDQQGYAVSCCYGLPDAIRFIEAYLRGEEFF